MSADSSCTSTDDNVTFSSTNNLEWNQKKHDMMLNLGLTNINSDADQTPTPTRFIRNCEEVGLFQDLQNVNPFDEVFKKAVENPVSLRIPVSSSDDTLHTPQIYPHLEENSKCSSTTAATDYSLNKVISTAEDDGDKPLIIVLDPEANEILSEGIEKRKATLPIKRTVDKRTRKASIDVTRNVVATLTQNTSSGLTPIPINKLIDYEKLKQELAQDDGNLAETDRQRENDILRQREANKAAQSRCRKRKQIEFEKMSEDIINLRNDNLKLKNINLYLQETIKKLQTELKAVKASSSLQPNAAPASPSPSIISTTVAHNQSIRNNHQSKEQVIIGNQVKVNLCQKKLNKLAPIAPNVKDVGSNVSTVVVAAPTSLGLPVQNIQSGSNNTVVFLYPMPSQSVIVPSSTTIQRDKINLKPKSKISCKRLVPK